MIRLKKYCYFESIQVLIDRGFDINEAYSKGNTLLHYSVYKGDFSLVKFWVAHKSEIDKQNKFWDSPLDLAASENYRNDSIAVFLINNGANPSTTCRLGFTALRNTVGFWGRMQNEKLYNELIEHGADVTHYSDCSKCCDISVLNCVVLWGTVEILSKYY